MLAWISSQRLHNLVALVLKTISDLRLTVILLFGELALVLNLTAASLQSFFWVCSDIRFTRLLVTSLLKKASITQTKTSPERKRQNWCIKHALEWQLGRGNPFFIEMRCQLGCSECNSCDIKRKESQGESERSNSLKSDSGSSKTMLEKVALFAGLQLWVGLRGSQYAAGDKGVCMDPTHHWIHSNTQKVMSSIWPKNPAEQLREKGLRLPVIKKMFSSGSLMK